MKILFIGARLFVFHVLIFASKSTLSHGTRPSQLAGFLCLVLKDPAFEIGWYLCLVLEDPAFTIGCYLCLDKKRSGKDIEAAIHTPNILDIPAVAYTFTADLILIC